MFQPSQWRDDTHILTLRFRTFTGTAGDAELHLVRVNAFCSGFPAPRRNRRCRPRRKRHRVLPTQVSPSAARFGVRVRPFRSPLLNQLRQISGRSSLLRQTDRIRYEPVILV